MNVENYIHYHYTYNILLGTKDNKHSNNPLGENVTCHSKPKVSKFKFGFRTSNKQITILNTHKLIDYFILKKNWVYICGDGKTGPYKVLHRFTL